jgi:uncharacterized glyoxalase superfamily protein PhnB
VIAMDITIHSSFLPHTDPDASLAFYRDTLGFEVRNDVGYGGMRWITVGPAEQPGTSIVLYPPGADPGITDDERRTIVEMMAKGTYGIVVLATKDLDGTFERLQAGDAEVVQEPTEQPYGIRDCAFRDPAGNMVRINELPDLHGRHRAGGRGCGNPGQHSLPSSEDAEVGLVLAQVLVAADGRDRRPVPRRLDRLDGRGHRRGGPDRVGRLPRPGPHRRQEGVRSGGIVLVVGGPGVGGATGDGRERLLVRWPLGVGEAQVGQVHPGRVAQAVDPAAHSGGDAAVALVPPADQLAGVPDAAVVDLDRLRLPGEHPRRLVHRHVADCKRAGTLRREGARVPETRVTGRSRVPSGCPVGVV